MSKKLTAQQRTLSLFISGKPMSIDDVIESLKNRYCLRVERMTAYSSMYKLIKKGIIAKDAGNSNDVKYSLVSEAQ